MDSRKQFPGLAGRGFTLLELVVVITIIGILGTMVVVKVSHFPGTARREVARRGVRSIVDVATMIHSMTGDWPQSLADLRGRRGKNGEQPPSIEGDGKDPWGHEYIYEVVDGEAVGRSLGKDGREGGEGEDADEVWPRPEDS